MLDLAFDGKQGGDKLRGTGFFHSRGGACLRPPADYLYMRSSLSTLPIPHDLSSTMISTANIAYIQAPRLSIAINRHVHT